MQVHQYLSAPVRTARCQEIEVEIEDSDNKAGAISLALLLTDGTLAKKLTLFLGQKVIASSSPGRFEVKRAPVFETLKFSIPENASVHKFDEITVMLLPDLEHEFVAQKSQFSNFNYFRDNTDNHGLLNSVLQTRRGNQP